MPTVRIPELTFEVDEDFALHTLAFLGPEAAGTGRKLVFFKSAVPFRANIVATLAGEGADPAAIDRYVDEQLGSLKGLVGYEVLERKTVTCASGAAGVWLHHAFRDEGGLAVEQFQLYVPGASGVVVLTATHLAGEPFAAVAPRFTKMLLSFRAG